MKVLHVSSSDTGGAGGVAMTLTDQIRERGVESQLLVGNKQTTNDSVREFEKLPLDRELNFLVERVLSLNGLAGPSSHDFPAIVEEFDADVVHLHNLHSRFFNILNLLRLPEELPLVWTFHDMWPITGKCVYAYGCERYRDSCGSCPELDTYPELAVDTTSLLLRTKRAVIDRRNITAVCPSRWLADHAEASRMSFRDIRHIPNGVDTDRFRPRDAAACREHFDIPDDDRVVLFTAGQVGNERKGLSELLTALRRLPEKEDTTLLVVGGGDFDAAEHLDGHTVRQPGYVPEADLPIAYAAADVFVLPSKADNCPMVVLEAMASGTPVVGFPVGGIVEQIADGTGWLCESADADALAATLGAALSDPEELAARGEAARERALSAYSLEEFLDRHVALYDELAER